MKGPSMYPNYKSNGSGAKGNIPGQQKSGYKGMADGRATSSPFQMTEEEGKTKKKTKEDYIKEGFTPADADKMIADGAVTGEVSGDGTKSKKTKKKTTAKEKSLKPTGDQGDFIPAYPGADISEAEYKKQMINKKRK